jgi:hypothetical protein
VFRVKVFLTVASISPLLFLAAPANSTSTNSAKLNGPKEASSDRLYRPTLAEQFSVSRGAFVKAITFVAKENEITLLFLCWTG